MNRKDGIIKTGGECRSFNKRFAILIIGLTAVFWLSLFIFELQAMEPFKEPLIEVVETAWTNGIGDGNNYLEKFEGPVRDTTLYFWMRIRVKREALDVLRDKGELPIRHKWFRYTGFNIIPDKVQKPIFAFNPDSLRTDSEDYCELRVWSVQKNIRPGKWLVQVVYTNSLPVLCAEGKRRKPCEYIIDVQKGKS